MAGPPSQIRETIHVREVVERQLHDIMNKADFGPGIVEDATTTAEPIGEAVGGAAAAASLGDAAVFAVAGVFIGEFLELIFLASIVISIRVLRYIEQFMVRFVRLVPYFGSKASNLIRIVFSVIDPLENAVAGAAAQLLIGQITTLQNMFAGFLGLFGYSVVLPGSTTPRPSNQIGSMENQITRLQKQVNYLIQHMNVVKYVTNDPSNTSSVPTNMWHQIHSIQADVANLQKSYDHLDDRLNNQDRRISNVQHRIEQLSGAVHDVRHVATGWQDVEEMVGNLQTRVTQFVNSTTADLTHVHHEIQVLEPLSILLSPGTPGLKVLRQLEDTPCMCPAIPNLPALTPEWLGIYEFITNG